MHKKKSHEVVAAHTVSLGGLTLNHLITETEMLLNNGNFKYAVCGGYAIELL
jgi:hypothetical protein